MVGCFQKIQELIEDNVAVCVAVALGFAALEVTYISCQMEQMGV